jgi:hypothetical protein
MMWLGGYTLRLARSAGGTSRQRAGIFAASGDALIAKDGAVIAGTTYRAWLAR